MFKSGGFPLSHCILIFFLTLAGPAFAFEEGALHIWINKDKGFNGLAAVGQRFEADTGIRVIVETPESLTTEFDHSGFTSRAPDIVIWPHDRFGSWINEGLLEAVDPSPSTKQALAPFSWNAVTVGDRIYGYPIATEVVSLLYNRELISEPPRTLADVAALDRRLRKDGKRAIAWDYNNVYFSWPIIAGAGGYSFGTESSGIYDLTDVGVATPGAIDAVQAIRDLLVTGVLAPSSSYASMMEDFKGGSVAMIINGPWAWSELREAGIDIGIADVPALESAAPGKPFVGVLAAGISAASPHAATAKQFLEEYLLTEEGLREVNDDKPLGAVTHLKMIQALSDDPFIEHTFRSASQGEIMPHVPEMKRFWDLVTRRFSQMMAGESPIEPTLLNASKRLRRLDDIRGWTRRHYLVDSAN
ncbi:maltose/maltodextrin ABC transporter substrate-binding protein MalE [Marinobacter sp. 1Y8]